MDEETRMLVAVFVWDNGIRDERFPVYTGMTIAEYLAAQAADPVQNPGDFGLELQILAQAGLWKCGYEGDIMPASEEESHMVIHSTTDLRDGRAGEA